MGIKKNKNKTAFEVSSAKKIPGSRKGREAKCLQNPHPSSSRPQRPQRPEQQA